MPGLADCLKTATTSAHASLEAYVPFLDPQLSLQDYERGLRIYFGFYAPLE